MKRITLTIAIAAATITGAMAQDHAKIGVLGDMSGLFSPMSGNGSVVAAELAVEDFGGKVLGRDIEIVSGDHQNKSDVGAGIARKWYEADGVTMITDVWGSQIALAVQAEARRTGRIAVYTGAGSADLVGKECIATGFVWPFVSDSLATAVATALLGEGLDSWYFLVPDYVFGKQLQETATKIVEDAGGKVLGSALFPIVNQEFASLLLGAQASKAKVIVQNGGDIAAAMKQANEFGIMQSGQKFAAMILYLPLAKSIGLDLGQGLYITNSFYWDMTEESRVWSKRYFDKVGAMPTMSHAATYSAVLHYLKGVEKAGTLEAQKVAAAMRELPVSDATVKGNIREDGRLMRDYYLWQMKNPGESTGEWDLLKLVQTIPGDSVAPPAAEGGCSLVK